MPMMKGKSKEVVSKNVEMMMREGMSQDQAVAVAMRKAKKRKGTMMTTKHRSTMLT